MSFALACDEDLTKRVRARPPVGRLVAVLLAPAGVACAPGPGGGCELPAASGAHGAVDNTAVFTLPDRGGVLVNGAPVARDSVAAVLRDVFAPRRPTERAVFVWPPADTRCADVAFIARAARAAGGAAYDAARSGWPVEIPAPVR